MKLVWFRNDLRTGDHEALYHACNNDMGEGVLAVVVLTPKQWFRQDEAKSRVQFYLANLRELQAQLSRLNIPLTLLRAPTNKELPAVLLQFAQQHGVSELLFNYEYPDYEQKRDRKVFEQFNAQGIDCRSFHSDIIFAPNSLLTQQGAPFKVFTPFSKAWRKNLDSVRLEPLPQPLAQEPVDLSSSELPSEFHYELDVGADWQSDIWPAGENAATKCLRQFVANRFANYADQRDHPAVDGTSSLSPYLSVGVLSSRQCIAAVREFSPDPDCLDSQWVTELIWREFYRHLIVQFPEMNRGLPFRPEVESKIEWQYDEKLFAAWCRGETGVAIVDAAMKQLLATGWMHNRLRMVTASYLTKILRQDWRLGARFFMQHLIDGDFASKFRGLAVECFGRC